MSQSEELNYIYMIISSINDVHDESTEIFTLPKGRVLLHWERDESFRACARFEKKGCTVSTDEYSIVINYGVIDRLRSFMDVFNQFRSDHLFKAQFLSAYERVSEDIFSPNMNKTYIEERLVKLCSMWIYYHELSHIVQGHRQVAKELHSENCEEMNIFYEAPNIAETNAIDRYLFEFSADREACIRIIPFLKSTDKDEIIYKRDIWIFIVGMHQTFEMFNENYNIELREIKGSHPHPAIRLKLIVKYIIESIKVFARDLWAESEEEINELVNSAIYMAESCRKSPYNGKISKMNIFEKVDKDDYAKSLYNRLQEINKAINKNYFGCWNFSRFQVNSPEDFC
ncbi:hypothetical protein HKD28_02980 [Gluconobacter sp. LMG 1744]|uniref:hypothetical protein n=1 Tax=Gluconobacter cadivus TaxID=2728101 RepID=UPI0018851F14|nr:hypothetical protein [Gluconobacter cadivus]MBF0890393.1 hypothetical protein [Gluconobacter cadivus]